MAKAIDLRGQRFGRLVVIERCGSSGNYAAWRCQCDCGNEIITRSSRLINGGAQSCGCLRAEKQGLSNLIHGGCKERLYKTWRCMKDRCYNMNHNSYPDYGGRGIKVCEEWRNDYAVFRNWALNSGYVPGLTIERENVNGDYCPENCRWATMKEQASNRRNNRIIEFNGERHTISEWADIIDIPQNALRHRIDRGWPVERALTEPMHFEKITTPHKTKI